jgi:hypothetical protein
MPPKQNSLAGWLEPAPGDVLDAPKPAAPQKRKRTTAPIDTPDAESKDNSTKKQKVSKKAPTTKKPLAKEAPEGKKAAEQLYKKILDDVDKKVSSLDARVQKMGPNGRSITSDTYAEAMLKYIKDVQKLMAMGQDGARCALNAMLYIGPHAHGDLEASWKMCGFGESEEPYKELDKVMLEVIALKEDVDCLGKDEGVELPSVRHRWTSADAEVGVFKTGRPNKQQRGQIERQKTKWIKERFAEARKRREKVGDWIGNAIEELKGESADIERYGLEGYFKKSIAKLEEIRVGGEGALKDDSD